MCSSNKSQWKGFKPSGSKKAADPKKDATKEGGKGPKKDSQWGYTPADALGAMTMLLGLYVLGFFGSPFSEPELESIDFQHFRNELLAKDLVDRVRRTS
jgi:hypothetical protein